MNHKPNNKFPKYIFGIVLTGMILTFYFGKGSSPSARAQEAWTESSTGSTAPTETPTEPAPPIQMPPEVTSVTPTPGDISDSGSNPYFSVNMHSLGDGTVVEEMIIKGPPAPPPGFETELQAVTLPKPDIEAGINSLQVPAYPWIYGCSAVSGAMIAGYYDRNGYQNMYTGPTDGGVMPLLDDPSWGTWVDDPPSPYAFFTYYNNPLVASKNSLDGRTTRGSIDDYWVNYFSPDPDPYIGHWTQHIWGDAIGDFMLTSQSTYKGKPDYGLADAYTRFYDNWENPAAPLTCATIESYTKPPYAYPPDGTLGRKQFYEARGYTVTDCYNQFTDNQYPGGFSFTQYKAEIDAGRPVMLNLAGHTIVGIGYDNATNTIYIHDTWDSSDHTMIWGGSYAGMALEAVSIVNLAPVLPDLKITNLTVLPSAPSPNDDIHLSVDVSNLTGVNATTFRIEFYVDDIWRYCWYLGVPERGYFTRAAGLDGNKSGTWSFTIPAGGLSLGNHTINAYVDSGCEVAESNEGNNNAGPVSVTVGIPTPGAFSKTSPFNGNANQSTNPMLSWEASINVVNYEYCIDTINNNACNANWISTGTNTSAALSGLAPGTYYWITRARNSTGITYSNGSYAAWWSFTILPTPGGFNKIRPVSGATNQPPNPTLRWGTSSNVINYNYCVSTSASCSTPSTWISTGTSPSVTLSGLTTGTWYWQVRAANATGITYANGESTWWSFTVLPYPGSFTKSSPTNGATNQPTNPTLRWGISSSAVSYEYCFDTSNDNACASTWISTGTNTSAVLSGLTPGTWYWQVRAANASGSTYADGVATWWSFTILAYPGAFNKSSPTNGATNQPANPILRWGTSNGVTRYEYCIDTINDRACNASWVSVGTNTSVNLSGLAPGMYYWHVRARNSTGITYSNGSYAAWWSFTIPPAPGAFNKTSPFNGNANQPTNPILSWGASGNANNYEYCIDTIKNYICDATWISTGSKTNAALGSLIPGKTYYWHVRARNISGITYSNGVYSAWWSFTILP